MNEVMTYEELMQQAIDCATTIRRATQLLQDTHLALEAIEISIKNARADHKKEYLSARGSNDQK